VHPNTLRNRLHKVEELLRRSLDDTRSLVDLSLGLEALRLLRRGQTPIALASLPEPELGELPGGTDPAL
jgi:hypothetical protein